MVLLGAAANAGQGPDDAKQRRVANLVDYLQIPGSSQPSPYPSGEVDQLATPESRAVITENKEIGPEQAGANSFSVALESPEQTRPAYTIAAYSNVLLVQAASASLIARQVRVQI